MNADLTGARFDHATLTNVRFVGTQLFAASFANAYLEHVEFKDVNLGDANFYRARHSATFTNTTCLDGRDSDEVGGTCEGGHM